MQEQSLHKNTLEAKVFTKGTIKLPITLRNELDIHDGDKVLFIKNGNSWIITTHLNNIRDTQELIRHLKKDNSSIVRELIQERRKEAKKEFN